MRQALTRFVSRSRVWNGVECFVVLASLLASGCVNAPELDLEGPRVVAVTPTAAQSLRAPTAFQVEVTLSEPLDRASVHAGSVSLLSWDLGDPCRWNRDCEDAICVVGRCQSDPIGPSQLTALLGARFDDDESTAISFSWVEGAAGAGSRLVINSSATLAPYTKYTLLIGAVTDRAGAPLVDESGLAAVYRHDFTTGSSGSGGPEGTLTIPAAGTDGVPPNLALLEVVFSQPVAWPWPQDAALTLTDEQGESHPLGNATHCPDAIPGTCLRLQPISSLHPKTRYRLAGGSFVDRNGRSAVAPYLDSTFRTALLPDLIPPTLQTLSVRGVGNCIVGSFYVDEPVELALAVDGQVSRHSGQGNVDVALRHPNDLKSAWSYELTLSDLAGNRVTAVGTSAGDPFAPASPSLALVEVLADPVGPESEGEFIELVALADGDAEDLRVADLSWDDVLNAHQSGDDDIGDSLGPLSWKHGDVLVVGGEAFIGDGVPAIAQIVRVTGPLGQAGLKNSGEPVTIFGTDPLRRVTSYLPIQGTSSGASAVRLDPTACDVVSAWRPHPLGTATPGALP